MRILFNYYSGSGGGCENIRQLLRVYALAYSGDHVGVLTAEGSTFDRTDWPDNVHVFVVKSKVKELGRIRFLGLLIRKVATEFSADVVWSINHGPLLPTGVPNVLTLNNAFQIYPWKETADHPQGVVHRTVMRLMFYVSLKRTSVVMVQTNTMASILRSRFSGAFRSVVVPKAVEGLSGISAKEPSAIPLDWVSHLRSRDEFTWLYVATAIPHKNHRVVIDAIARLNESGTRTRLVLTISTDELKGLGIDDVEKLVEERRVLPIGWADKGELRWLYAQCDGCVMPSRMESLSSAHLEAMSWGCPQVSSDYPFARETCQDAALYADANNVEDWQRQMSRLISNDNLRNDLIAKGISRMKAFPSSWEDVAAKVRSIFSTEISKTES